MYHQKRLPLILSLLLLSASCSQTLSEPPPNQPDTRGSTDDASPATGPTTSTTLPVDAPPASTSPAIDPAAPAPWTPPTKAQLASHPEWFSCSVDSDCEVIELGCCDHCNAGAALSVHKDHVNDAAGAWKEPSCFTEVEPGTFQGRVCTELGCGRPTGACQKKVCVGMDAGIVRPNPIGR